MATLVDSSRNYKHIDVLVYIPSASNLIETIFREASKKAASGRLLIKDGRYMYTPSDEYNNLEGKLIRFKNFKR